MTALSRELARKQPADVQVREDQDGRRVINGHVVARDTGLRILGLLLFALLAFLFAGYLLSAA